MHKKYNHAFRSHTFYYIIYLLYIQITPNCIFHRCTINLIHLSRRRLKDGWISAAHPGYNQTAPSASGPLDLSSWEFIHIPRGYRMRRIRAILALSAFLRIHLPCSGFQGFWLHVGSVIRQNNRLSFWIRTTSLTLLLHEENPPTPFKYLLEKGLL